MGGQCAPGSRSRLAIVGSGEDIAPLIEVTEFRIDEDLRTSIELRLPDDDDDVGGGGGGETEGGGGGSYPRCCTPNIQIGSVLLSGVASLSSKYRTALSRWPFPCRAAVKSPIPPVLDLGELDGPLAPYDDDDDVAAAAAPDGPP